MIEEFKDRLKISRKTRGFTQKQLSELSGLNESLISHLEIGDRQPSYETLKKLSVALSVSSDYLLCIERPTKRPSKELILAIRYFTDACSKLVEIQGVEDTKYVFETCMIVHNTNEQLEKRDG